MRMSLVGCWSNCTRRALKQCSVLSLGIHRRSTHLWWVLCINVNFTEVFTTCCVINWVTTSNISYIHLKHVHWYFYFFNSVLLRLFLPTVIITALVGLLMINDLFGKRRWCEPNKVAPHSECKWNHRNGVADVPGPQNHFALAMAQRRAAFSGNASLIATCSSELCF